MRIVFRFQNPILDEERMAALNQQLASLAVVGWVLERWRWVSYGPSGGIIELQMRADGDEERLNAFLRAVLRAGQAGWHLAGSVVDPVAASLSM
ncbi:hypothetical protein [Nannocystis sp. SCPEA4]|uniref:hypothetical protein n=1 Tax=Nannocystis sp. SCPEA4 TaxID=2996787 RepID=UPI002271F705|nr:hypothetical protein [Nannocystis sp. SCPEA4]MCY1062141.1 hypothetical protein [Nannocystis sp. SCPEA4]